jgi:hypothetical protein
VADYVLLYTGGSMPETEEEQAKVMAAWDVWFGQIGDGLKDGGNPFGPDAKTVGTGGSVSEAPSPRLTGYTIVAADSLESATSIAKGSPVLQGGGSVTVYETFAVM